MKVRFPYLAPVTTITLAAFVAAGLAVLSALLSMSSPWLGIEFDRDYGGDGIRILAIKSDSPAQDKLHAGDIITALVTPAHGRVELSSLATMEEPDQLATYAEYNAFFALQHKVWDEISSPDFTAILSDLRSVKITPANTSSATMLPAEFWWLIFFGGTSFILGASIWSMRRSEPMTRTLAVSGIGFMLGSYSCAIYVSRELALPAKLFYSLAALNHIGIMMFAYATILFFWYFPQRLGRGPAAWIYTIFVAALWLNETLQLLSWPGHAYYAHFIFAYSVLVVFSYLQWRKSRSAPQERAMLKWMLTNMLFCMGFTVALFYGPVIFTGKPIASTILTFGSVFVFYIGLLIGNIRYHQFDMELWWLRAWQWLMLLFIALIADALFIYYLHVSTTVSLGLIIVIGIVYQLSRQWLWGLFSKNNDRTLDSALPHLVDALMLHQHKTTPDQQWHQLIKRVFNPLSIKIIQEQSTEVSIQRSGLALQLPDIYGVVTMEALCCDKGNRLFTPGDVSLSNRLLELMRQSSDIVSAHAQGRMEERERIQRDLHDDVAARLLSLLHQTHDPKISLMARKALRGLRDVINLLDAEDASLMEVMTEIEAETREQISGLEIDFEWHSPDHWPEISINAMQHINLRRIARETIANALKHAHPGHIRIGAELNELTLSLRISHDGAFTEPANWISNRGLNNIQYRVLEMKASHTWGIEQQVDNAQYCQLSVHVPLTHHEDLEQYPADRRLSRHP
jgi:signal transduction histidine kinase